VHLDGLGLAAFHFNSTVKYDTYASARYAKMTWAAGLHKCTGSLTATGQPPR
jgi:hypothetical protein